MPKYAWKVLFLRSIMKTPLVIINYIELKYLISIYLIKYNL